ncbi:MAG: PrgI family protein [Patescibacteria group bacterium]|jgi:hypothetical protein
MATKIPQNVDIEDKLVGPLTLKQFLYVLGGAAAVFVTYQYYNLGYLFFHEFIIISLVAVVLAIALAFVKINGRPFIVFVNSWLGYLASPKQRLWKKDNTIREEKIKVAAVDSSAAAAEEEAISKSELERLANILDTGGKMNAEQTATTHEVSTIQPATVSTPEATENELGVEDILEKTDL